jgi:hypothetical protein
MSDEQVSFDVLAFGIIDRYERVGMQTLVELSEHSNDQLNRLRDAAISFWTANAKEGLTSLEPQLVAASHVIDNVGSILENRVQNIKDMAEQGYHREWFDGGVVETVPLEYLEQPPTEGVQIPAEAAGPQTVNGMPGACIVDTANEDAIRSRLGLTDDEPFPCQTPECENLATCYGAYDGEEVETPACDECCGHSQETGHCVPIETVSSVLSDND